MTDQSREAFEKWAISECISVNRSLDGTDGYFDGDSHIAWLAWQAAMEQKDADRWQPIETAPKDQLVMVYTPPTIHDYPDSVNIRFDHIDSDIADDYWYEHGEHYEHYCCVAKPEGSTGPSERAPYTHWMPLPAAPKQEGST